MSNIKARLLCFVFLKDSAGDALKIAAPALGSDQQKWRLWLRNTFGWSRILFPILVPATCPQNRADYDSSILVPVQRICDAAWETVH